MRNAASAHVINPPETFSNAIFDFVGHVAQATTVEELQSRYLDGIGLFVESSAVGLYVLNPFTYGTESVAARGVSDFFLTRYEEFGRPCDPVLKKIVAERRPVHNRELMSLDDWTGLPVRRGVPPSQGGQAAGGAAHWRRRRRFRGAVIAISGLTGRRRLS
jgi:hypothetical protein